MRILAALPYRALRWLLRMDEPVPLRTDEELAAEVERLARRKPVIVNLGLFTDRLPLWGLIVAAMLATRSPQLALTVCFVSYAGHGVGAGIVASAWQELIARCFPVNSWKVPGVVMEFCEPQRLPTYVGIGNTGVGRVGVIAPLIGAGLAGVSYDLLFAVSCPWDFPGVAASV